LQVVVSNKTAATDDRWLKPELGLRGLTGSCPVGVVLPEDEVVNG
jgi:hypothetical protein